MWHPAKASTFVLPVFEIEQIVVQLQNALSNSSDNTAQPGQDSNSIKLQIEKQINNWNTVLSNYRNYNDQLTPVFTVENMQFLNMTKSFATWRTGSISDSDLLTTVQQVAGDDTGALFSQYSSSFANILNTCNGVVPQYRSQYLNAICNDFDSTHWQGFASLLTGACDMPGTPNGLNNPLRNAPFMNAMCQQRSAAAASALDIPGGISGDDTDSIFGFLQSKDKFLTFGSNFEMSLSWTSGVTDSTTFNSKLESAVSSDSSTTNTKGGAILTVTADFNDDVSSSSGYGISIGKSTSNNHGYERTVSITLGDRDYGNIVCYSFIV